MPGTSGSITIFVVVLLFLVFGAFLLIPRYPKVSSNDPAIQQIKYNFSLIDPAYGKIPIVEGNNGAYTDDKRIITLCIKDPKTGKYYDQNTLMYVSLHELAHIKSVSNGHNEEFKTNFANLLRQGAELGIYDPRYPPPDVYCGVNTVMGH